MDFMPAPRQRDAELRRNGARAAVRRVTGDANLHSTLSHHSRAAAAELESSGFIVVTAAAGSGCLNHVRCRFAYWRVSIMILSRADDKSTRPSTWSRMTP